MPQKWLARWSWFLTPPRSHRAVSRLSCQYIPAVRTGHGPLSTSAASTTPSDVVPLRKQLKDAAKAARATQGVDLKDFDSSSEDRLAQWQLTVGIEIHAQLNTARKLFSDASTTPSDTPNSQLSEFDLALPGSQPQFQIATLIPALRAAIALNCQISRVSHFDRKHYFYHDQPAGYQITQYYQPFARDGWIALGADDGLPVDEKELVVGIKQVQMEQDTAKTQEQDDETSLIDFNRSGHALIEIISLPHLHSPEAASAYVRKVQALLFSVDAVTTGMEMGGLRADVNVSVRRRDGGPGQFSYSGVRGLGQRTEIKNLSSFKGVEDAIKAERDRQIQVLETGGVIEGETRGWSLTSPGETRRLRGKEGEVDYRYMPDPDLPPLYLSADLVQHLTRTLPPIPTQLVDLLTTQHGLSPIDARSLLALDHGQRLVYFQDVVEELQLLSSAVGADQNGEETPIFGKVAGNWVLHELGSLLSGSDEAWRPARVPATSLAQIIHLQLTSEITSKSAKAILRLVFDGDESSIDEIVAREGLSFEVMDDSEYHQLAVKVMAAHPTHVSDIQERGKHGKIKYLVGQMMQMGDAGSMEAAKAKEVLRQLLIKSE